MSTKISQIMHIRIKLVKLVLNININKLMIKLEKRLN